MSSLAELNRHLFAALDRLDVESLTPEQIEQEVARAGAIVEVADRITENTKVTLQAAKRCIHPNSLARMIVEIAVDEGLIDSILDDDAVEYSHG